MKKLLSVFLTCLLAAGVLAGCGGTSGASSSSVPDEAPAVEPASDGSVEAPVEAPAEESVATSDGSVLIVGLDDQFPPMGYRDEAGEIVGFDIDLAKEVGKRLGMEVVLQPINWSAKEMELDGGKVDCLWNGMTITEERKANMLVTPPYLMNAQVIVVKADSAITSKADLADKIVALQNGSSAEEAFSNPENGVADIVKEKVGYDDNVMALNDLEIGRVDALIVDKIVAEYYMNKKAGTYKLLSDELAAEEFGIAFKKDNTELHDKVCQALRDMVEDGTAKAISETWFGEDRVIFE